MTNACHLEQAEGKFAKSRKRSAFQIRKHLQPVLLQGIMNIEESPNCTDQHPLN